MHQTHDFDNVTHTIWESLRRHGDGLEVAKIQCVGTELPEQPDSSYLREVETVAKVGLVVGCDVLVVVVVVGGPRCDFCPNPAGQ